MRCTGKDADMPERGVASFANNASSAWSQLEPAQGILAALLVLEIAIFSLIGTNFLSVANAFEVLRLSVEIGLLAVGLTPGLPSGGIDLSGGGLMGASRGGVVARVRGGG